MSLSDISPEKKKEEEDIQICINTHIDNNESLVFSAGAGSGKTYALAESLKHIITNHGKRLDHYNQKILCITYTNVAANEIKKRLGNSHLVKVSTIHERLWNLIKDYKKELLQIHIEKISKELDTLFFDLNENDEPKLKKQLNAYRELSKEQRDDFRKIVRTQKENYYTFYDASAKEFRLEFEKYLKEYPSILRNVAYLKKIVNLIYKIDNYRQCLENIRSGNTKYQKVIYENKYNKDILHKMIISHDTLLEYAWELMKTYDLLKRIIIDRFPYILIDEFQDTNRYVVWIMKLLEDYAKNKQYKIFIGYFGDPVQNIYEDGVGSSLYEIHTGLKKIDKRFNRRSYSEIIEVINKIRKDSINQVSIYDESIGGSVKFYTGSDNNKHKFINVYKRKWNIDTENKLHCLVLTNKYVAEFNGFPDIFNQFAATNFYRKNYDRINNELLSNDLTKLGEIPIRFYRLLEFIDKLTDSKTTLNNFFEKKNFSEISFYDLKEIFTLLNSFLDCHSLGEFIQKSFDNSINGKYRNIVNDLLIPEFKTYPDLINYLLGRLFLNHGSGIVQDFKIKLQELFNNELIANAETGNILELKNELNLFLENEFFMYIDIDEVKEFKNKLNDFLKNKEIFTLLKNTDMNLFTKKIDTLFKKEIFSIIDIDEVESAKEQLKKLLDIDLKQWKLWYDFIKNEQKADVLYHTYHGTKGAEYENVIIIMENDFGKFNRNKFSSFFKQYVNIESLSEEEKIEFANTRNLLYVSCSRAIKNLRILYLNDVTEFKDGIEKIFDRINRFED